MTEVPVKTEIANNIQPVKRRRELLPKSLLYKEVWFQEERIKKYGSWQSTDLFWWVEKPKHSVRNKEVVASKDLPIIVIIMVVIVIAVGVGGDCRIVAVVVVDMEWLCGLYSPQHQDIPSLTPAHSKLVLKKKRRLWPGCSCPSKRYDSSRKAPRDHRRQDKGLSFMNKLTNIVVANIVIVHCRKPKNFEHWHQEIFDKQSHFFPLCWTRQNLFTFAAIPAALKKSILACERLDNGFKPSLLSVTW